MSQVSRMLNLPFPRMTVMKPVYPFRVSAPKATKVTGGGPIPV